MPNPKWNVLVARAQRAEAERDHAQEVAELAEKDRRTYHRDALRAEAEVAELREKVEELRLIANVNGDWNVKYDQLRRERDELRATVDRVRASVSEWASRSHSGYYDEAQDDAWQIISAALDTAGGEQS